MCGGEREWLRKQTWNWASSLSCEVVRGSGGLAAGVGQR